MTTAQRRAQNIRFGVIPPPVHPIDEARVRAALAHWGEEAIECFLDGLKQWGPFDRALILTGMEKARPRRHGACEGATIL